MTTLNNRKKALEAVREQKIQQIQQFETARNKLLTEVVQIEGKLELLKELEHESSIENEKIEDIEN